MGCLELEAKRQLHREDGLILEEQDFTKMLNQFSWLLDAFCLDTMKMTKMIEELELVSVLLEAKIGFTGN